MNNTVFPDKQASIVKNNLWITLIIFMKLFKVIHNSSRPGIYEGEIFFLIISILFLKSSSVFIFSSIFSTP